MKIVILGLSITSSWGNGHATTYRGLVRELATRGHSVVFLERDVPWYAENRDAAGELHASVVLYPNVDGLRARHAQVVAAADAVIVGSYVPDGIAVGEWVLDTARGVTAFYDIDTPVTLAKIARGECEYLSTTLIPRYDLYLSFTGGPTLDRLEEEFRAPAALPLYCSVDPRAYRPEPVARRWDLGYLGTYSPDRQPLLETMLMDPAGSWREGRFVVAGPMYPPELEWPANVERIEHLPPAAHRRFYNEQRFTLNLTRADMKAAGYSPSVRLFEAAACGVPIISDLWDGLDELFEIGSDILVATSSDEVLEILKNTSARQAEAIGEAARERVLSGHTAAHRAAQLEGYLNDAATRRIRQARRAAVEATT